MMVKELTVAEISEALGYEVKVVKEQPKPHQFKAGDVVNFYDDIRVIVQIDGKLTAIDISGFKHCEYGTVQQCDYEKIGELKDYIK